MDLIEMYKEHIDNQINDIEKVVSGQMELLIHNAKRICEEDCIADKHVHIRAIENNIEIIERWYAKAKSLYRVQTDLEFMLDHPDAFLKEE